MSVVLIRLKVVLEVRSELKADVALAKCKRRQVRSASPPTCDSVNIELAHAT